MTRFFIRLNFCLLLLLLSACSEQEIITGSAKITQHYSKQIIKAADISADGKFSLLSDNQSVCLWNNDTNSKHYPCLNGLDAQLIELLGISHSNRYFYTSNRVNVHLYHLATGRLVTVWSAGDNIINDIAFSKDESTLVFAFRSGQASVASIANNQINTYQIHRLDINSVDISADGKIAFTGASDKLAKTWLTATGEEISALEHQSRVNHVVINDSASTAFSLDAIRERFFWHTNTTKMIAQLESNIRFIEFNDADFSDNNEYLFTGSPKQKLQAWHVNSGQLIAQWQAMKLEKRRSSVLSIQAINKTEIASITSDGIYQVWQFPLP